MQRSYLDYAMSVIVARALPDVRDGLKPVHRRILFAMKDMGLTHASTYKKSARIVGEVLGKYHPHGDTAVYDALVRLAQTFSMRYPLIAGQGNFGSVDGDSPAAMRYTEAKLAKITQELLADIDKKTVDFVDNFDGSQQEPTVLPAALPNLLLMGSEGIAVGMATKIPPHNLSEVVDAVIALIQAGSATSQPLAISPKPSTPVNLALADPATLIGNFSSPLTIEALLAYIKGPDFPTGGTIYDWASISQTYTTGKGKIIIRGQAEIEEDQSGKPRIVISELPYQVNKAKLVAKIADLVKRKRLVGIADIRDESDRQGLSIVIDLKRDARPKSILNNLYLATELQVSFPANMVALNSQGTPQLMNLKTILTEYIKHRQLVVARRAQCELISAQERAHILEGLLIALKHLDEVIDTIRRSPDADVARQRLMTKFELSELQATAILDMQLRRLAALERQKIEAEYQAIKAQIDLLIKLLSQPQAMLDQIITELKQIKAKYADDRLTRVIKAKVGEFSEEDLVAQEEVIITVTASGYIKRMPPATYKSQHRGGKGVTGMTTKDDDAVKSLISASTHDHLLIFTNKGKVFKLKVYELPTGSRQSKGQAIINLIAIDQEETIQAIIPVSAKLADIQESYITLATKLGTVKKTAISEFQNIRSTGIIAIILNDGDEVVWGDITEGHRHLLLVTHFGKSIRFPETQIRDTARDTKGVRGILLKPGDYLVTVEAIDPRVKPPADKRKKWFRDILVITEKGMGKRTPITEYPLQNRGGQGVKVMNLSPKTGQIAAALGVNQQVDQIFITTLGAQIVKLPIQNIPQLKRPTQGVILMRFAKSGDTVAATATINKEDLTAD
ncbi:DNA gyrase subunit A [Microgenomates group bacterium RBG_16_45_19]|nr:MAG: DNA gyrase subunit A [Microgenomates group bacterium RBG_16_45_19]